MDLEEYLVVREATYTTDQYEAINCLMTMQAEQAQRRAPRYRIYGKLDSDTGNQMGKKKLLWKYESICSQSRNTRTRAIKIQERIRSRDDFLIRFGGSRGERYISVLKFRWG